MEHHPESSADVTQILEQWRDGDREAASRLMPLVYQELRARAADYLRRERADHTLQATALVHEAYLKLAMQDHANWKNRAHFCAIAATLMRRILVQHARQHNREKRGGQWQKVYLDETRELHQENSPELLDVDAALRQFGLTYPRESSVVEMKFFGGMEMREIAEVLNVSEKTILRDWSFAKAWLSRALVRAMPTH